MLDTIIDLVSPQGRINRTFYLGSILFLSIFGALTGYAMVNFAEWAYICDKLWLIIFLYSFSFMFFSLACFGIYLFCIFSMKRLKDFSESGYWAILLFVPIINVLLLLYLLLMPGDPTRNAYGLPQG